MIVLFNQLTDADYTSGLPMAAMPFYHNLGVNWATSTLGFISVALFPVPVIFYVYGAKIRSWSKYAPS